MILHLAADEKFIDDAISQFDAVNERVNEYWVISKKETPEFVKSKRVKVFSFQKFLIMCILGKLNNFDAIIFHSLTQPAKIACLFSSARVKKAWVGFGFDYYSIIENDELCVLKPETRKIAIDIYGNAKANSLVSSIIKKIISILFNPKSIDYFSPVLFSEFSLVSEKFNCEMNYVDWNYCGFVNTLHLLGDLKVNYDSKKVLLGNSCTPTNNHIDAFKDVFNFGLGYKIVVPLSYGDTNLYKDKIVRLFYESFKSEDLQLLTDFISFDEYVNLLQDCPFVVMNHLRQQGLGNIIISLFVGAYVFLDKANPLYAFLSKSGFDIYSIDDIKTVHSLPKPDVTKNRSIILSIWGAEAQFSKTERFINIMTSNGSDVEIN
ncbi:TDP-N-acetylfucosamine:lipid II N-acetylfucosaminyltransferase [Serratia sp. N21D137]|uniref:TDP-N-acetylfucosamine:lipid II N-acetylfucosaminyltransferase n=1 Tax=Serratia sp. N21D137 TaxID=3397495 RepID=UPI0039E18027